MSDFKKFVIHLARDIISAAIYLFIFWRKRDGTVTLVYHSVDKMRPSEDPYRLNISPERFEGHLKVISKYKDGVRITFDDGFGNNFTNALGLLKRYGLTATVFLITDFIDGKIGSESFCGKGFKLKPLTWDEIRIMDGSGIAFGSHSKTHAHLASLSADAVRPELSESKRRIEGALGHVIEDLAYPFGNRGSFNGLVAEIAEEAGYRRAYTNLMGINALDADGAGDQFALRRVRVYSEDGPFKLKLKLKGAYDWVDSII